MAAFYIEIVDGERMTRHIESSQDFVTKEFIHLVFLYFYNKPSSNPLFRKNMS